VQTLQKLKCGAHLADTQSSFKKVFTSSYDLGVNSLIKFNVFSKPFFFEGL